MAAVMAAPRRLVSRGACAQSRRLLGTRALKPGGFFELRTDEVSPAALDDYVAASERLPPGALGAWKTALGGRLHTVQTLSYWDDYDQRDALLLDDEPSPLIKAALTSSDSVVMHEATAALESCGLAGAAGFAAQQESAGTGGDSARVAWELRQYQLVLGYATVPRFLELYTEGLRDKLAADDSGASQLATLLYSDSGSLNVVVELWRHESMQRAQASRIASRQAAKWKAAIGEIATISTSFSTRMMRPLPSSPWQ